MTKNKKLTMVAILMVAITLFSVTAFASAPNYTGYEALKEILKSKDKTQDFTSATFTGNLKVSDNEKTLFAIAGTAKMDETQKAASGTVDFSIDDINRQASFYGTHESAYFVDEQNQLNYQIINMDQLDTEASDDYSSRHYDRYDNENHKMDATGEAFLDYIVGDLKSQVELSNEADGTKVVSMDLVKSEIPTPINLLISAAAAEERTYDENEMDAEVKHMNNPELKALIDSMPFFQGLSVEDMKNLEDKMPVLKKDVVLEHLYVAFTLDANDDVQAMTLQMTITGKDAAGVAHEIVVAGTGTLTDLNSTSIDTFDTTGKDIQVIDAAKYKTEE